MKNRSFALTAFMFIFSYCDAVNAGLVARDINGDLTTDAYYDTDRNITWLRNANINGAMNWSAASAWASGLSIGGYSDWRLPKGDSCHIGACTSNEMSHLWNIELGNTLGGPMTNKGGFLNVQPAAYWTNYQLSSIWASEVNFANGDVGHLPTGNLNFAMAVRDGDVNSTSASPPARVLALLSADVYSPVSGADGSVAGNAQFGNYVLDRTYSQNDGFKANVYRFGDQTVIAVRGTDPTGEVDTIKNLVSDLALTNGSRLNPQIVSYTKDLAVLLNDLSANPTYDGRKVTLTGHSLGGAVAQLVGAASGSLNVTTFDAPGSRNILTQTYNAGDCGLTSCNTTVKNVINGIFYNVSGAVNPSITNYRLFGDQVSMAGRESNSEADTQLGTTITVDNSGGNFSDGSTLLNLLTTALRNHSITTLANSIAAYCPDGALMAHCRTGYGTDLNLWAPYSDLLGGLLFPGAIAFCSASHIGDALLNAVWGGKNGALCEVLLTTLTAGNKAIDPPPGNAYGFKLDSGSPFLSSFSLPTLSNVFGWQLQYHDEFGWSSIESIMGQAEFIFDTDVDELTFVPLDFQGNPVFNPDSFVFGFDVASDGDFSATIYTFGNPAAIPTPPSLTLVLLALAAITLAGRYRRRRLLAPNKI